MNKRTKYILFKPGTEINVDNAKMNGVVTNDIIMTVEAEDVSDGYHTLTELYTHRHALFAALCKIYDNYITPLNTRIHCWKSKLHSDGTMEPNWFIAGMTINKPDKIEYITYHMPIIWWNNFNVIEIDKAPQWDGHTSFDIIKRLGEL